MAAWLLTGLLLAGGLAVAPRAGATAPDDVHTRRARQREAVRARAAGKADAQPFGLLVLPVDFADARAPQGWDPVAALGPRLGAAGRPGTLAHYFAVASQGRCDLAVVLGPLIPLAGVRRDYSDLGWNGNTRTRALAQQSLAAARALGVDFAAADRDGDGEVDGVLLLHADVGLENDLDDGLVVPLQYYLEAPVMQRGVRAQSYAVASWRSGVGVWAHETAHLFGLEDRYDPDLPSSGEAVPRGGLGVFSLMAAGYWGSGDAHDPALLDAYSASQLGWRDLVPAGGDGTVPLPLSGDGPAYRVWTDGVVGPEFFVLERRGPRDGYDGGVPAGCVVTHIDETLPEGQASSGQWPDRHLRARLVEADGDGSVARGLDAGDAADVYPGTTGNTRFAPDSVPPSDGYDGPSGVVVTGLTGDSFRVDDRVSFAATVVLDYGVSPPAFVVRLVPRGLPWQAPSLTATILAGASHGTFAGGALEVSAALAPAGDGTWSVSLPWQPAANLPAGAVTTLRLRVTATDGAGGEHVVADVVRPWAWTAASPPLDLAGAWPGAWRIEHLVGDGNTTWHRWAGASGVTDDRSPVLAATGAAYDDGSSWPEVLYANGSDVALVSELLPTAVTAVCLVHHVEAEALPTGVGVDGAVCEWVDGGGSVVTGVPVDGYPAVIARDAPHALHGRPAWTGVDSVRADGAPRWRLDVVPVPAGPGPWRLRLRLATSPLFRERGWLVARLDTLRTPPPPSAFPVAVAHDGAGDRVRWRWTAPLVATAFSVEASDDDGASWRMLGTAAAADTSMALAAPAAPRGRRLVRVVARTAPGDVVSRSVVWTTAADPAGPAGTLGLPRPNPGRTQVLIPVDAGQDGAAELQIVDLLGRVVRRWALAGGAYDILWDGADGDGRRCAAGVYVVRLREGGHTHHRKVTWLP